MAIGFGEGETLLKKSFATVDKEPVTNQPTNEIKSMEIGSSEADIS
jgi:hypothetical protein